MKFGEEANLGKGDAGLERKGVKSKILEEIILPHCRMTKKKCRRMKFTSAIKIDLGKSFHTRLKSNRLCFG